MTGAKKGGSFLPLKGEEMRRRGHEKIRHCRRN